MFISVCIDMVGTDSEIKVRKILNEYGLKKIINNVYESFDFPTRQLGNLKKDLEECLDMDDKLRIYQYPLEDSFKISFIEDKKWKRLSISH